MQSFIKNTGTAGYYFFTKKTEIYRTSKNTEHVRRPEIQTEKKENSKTVSRKIKNLCKSSCDNHRLKNKQCYQNC